jgi:hypothetical protein
VTPSPIDLLTAPAANTHLAEIPDQDYPAVRHAIEAALRGFIGETGERRGLATATKMLHLKRPALVPICDSYTTAMLGIPLKPNATKHERVQAGVMACDLSRAAARHNRDRLEAVSGYLVEQGFERTPVRILDVLLWVSYGGTIRVRRPRPPADQQ